MYKKVPMQPLELEKIEEMYRLQDKLNCDTNGSEWARSGVTKEGRAINWLRCIYMETVEAIDSLNWKHWKDIHAEDDVANLKVELVDIWHFMMSEHIVRRGLDKAIVEAANDIKTVSNEDALQYEKADKFFFLEQLMKSTVNGEFAFSEFLQTIRSIDGFDMQDVYTLYIGKNCLNQFRQDHGYKNGTYVKVWNGKEDNVYMQQALQENPNLGFDALYATLESLYKEL
jgi:dimeric dUTPase (all-alpha-NTP-PPase superfamily)